jgi:hypothetical protein
MLAGLILIQFISNISLVSSVTSYLTVLILSPRVTISEAFLAILSEFVWISERS